MQKGADILNILTDGYFLTGQIISTHFVKVEGGFSSMKKKLMAILIAVAVAITFVPTASFASAKANPIPKKIKTLYYPKLKGNWAIDGKNGIVLVYKSNWTFKMKKCKSSNKKVARIIYDSSNDGLAPNYTILINKAGKAKLKVYAKPTGSKKSYKKYTVKVTANKYVNPAKKFVIGTKDFTRGFDKIDMQDYEARALSGKLTVQAKKGWKVKSIQFGQYSDYPQKARGRTIKNGSLVTFNDEKGDVQLTVKYYNKRKNSM